MSNLSCGTHVAEPSANKDCRKLLNQFCRFLPKLKLPISADAKLPLTYRHGDLLMEGEVVYHPVIVQRINLHCAILGKPGPQSGSCTEEPEISFNVPLLFSVPM